MPAPTGPSHFPPSQLEHIFETIEIEARRVLHVIRPCPSIKNRVRLPPLHPSGIFDSFIINSITFCLLAWGHQPALRLDVTRQRYRTSVSLCFAPTHLRCTKAAITLIRPDELQRRAEAHEAFALGNNRCRWTKHRTSKFFVFAHGHQTAAAWRP